ncbi:type I secretion system permease/ATPase [Pseudomonas sp. TTU2014-080ASC]|uniref:type I secretion system permease/ATPase n=1 Tax=Pseudomonas sp. TTU2014-080ASC TaxID=1729724 RepID=UPI0007189476|nr:type I secretion system permease/ATPase [Pseudomonas sp. TTU2014-080ASC]KRW57688.1 ATP-binding protein [Pseudomonas sp. TTU2014-080ASC]
MSSVQNREAQPSPHEAWIQGFLGIARHYGLNASIEQIRVALSWGQGQSLEQQLEQMARNIGLSFSVQPFSLSCLDSWRLPLLADFGQGRVGLIESMGSDGQVGVRLGDEHSVVQSWSLEDVAARTLRVVILRPQIAVPDARVDDYIKPYDAGWFWKLALSDWPRYGDIMLASLVANLLALSSMIFSMQIYDRVIPAQSEPTLWVLFGGVMLAIVLEFCMRLARTHISDRIGKRADLRISDRVFGHALRIRSEYRSKSTGSFISQLRELEQVRELITSSTLGAIADLPFFFLFLVVLWMVAGSIALVPLAVIPLLVIPGLLLQKPLAKLAKLGMRESSLRNSMLVEAVQGIDDIKLLRAEAKFQNQWNYANEVTAGFSMRQRFITGAMIAWTQELQSLVYVTVILVGCFMVMNGDITTGALIGASILSSRMVAPLAQISGIMARWQQAKVAREGLEELMKRPVDQPAHSKRLHRPVLRGHFRLKGALFKYDPESKEVALNIADLEIRAGERVAILGRNGAGKSTLLQLLSGLATPEKGMVSLDGLSLPLIDPSDVRRDVGLLSQSSTLFYGTLRENVTLGCPQASDDEILKAMKLSGSLTLLEVLPDGLDHVLMEGGKGLSGGQRQSLLLARTLIRNPHVLLLDEPTAWLDEVTEGNLIQTLQPWLAGRTLVVATHRPALLSWAQRIIVLEAGRVVMDGSKEQVIKELSLRSGSSPAQHKVKSHE